MTILEQLSLDGNDHLDHLESLSHEELLKEAHKWEAIQTIFEAKAAITPDPEEYTVKSAVERLCEATPDYEEQIRDSYKAVCELEGWTGE